MNDHQKMIHALTQYDIKQSTKKFYNHYALGQYFMAVERVEEAVKQGKSLVDAIKENFCGRLQTVVLKSVTSN